MAGDHDKQQRRTAARGQRGVRRVFVFVLVVVAAALLGRLGSDLDADSAPDVEQSTPAASALV